MIRVGITDSDLVQGDENDNGDDVDMNVMVYDAPLSELRHRTPTAGSNTRAASRLGEKGVPSRAQLAGLPHAHDSVDR